MAHEAQNGLPGVVGVDPLEALFAVGVLPKRLLIGVQVVERLDEALLRAVRGVEIVGEEPFDGLVVAPLDLLADLVSHEGEFGAGVRYLVEEQRAQAREAAPVVTGHASDERALTVHDLVVAERQHEVL